MSRFAFVAIVTGLYIYQFTMFGVLSLSRFWGAPFLLVLPLATFMYHNFVKEQFYRAVHHGSLNALKGEKALAKEAPAGVEPARKFKARTLCGLLCHAVICGGSETQSPREANSSLMLRRASSGSTIGRTKRPPLTTDTVRPFHVHVPSLTQTAALMLDLSYHGDGQPSEARIANIESRASVRARNPYAQPERKPLVPLAARDSQPAGADYDEYALRMT